MRESIDGASFAQAMIHAAALVKSGTFKHVIVTAGGCTAKLGMNGKDHVKKGLPILEDMVGGFAVIVTQDDGVSPEINLELLGRHSVGTGSAPQAVISSLVTDPLDRKGLKQDQHFTQPPSRYTEASLIKALEEKGIGRPSTYAPTISTILNREYVVKEGRALRPTPLGEVVTGLMKDKFQDIVDPTFTAQMEEEDRKSVV